MNTQVSTVAAPERRARIEEIFARIDTLDPACLDPYLNADAEVTFGNQPALRGGEEIRAGNAAFFELIAGLRHQILGLWESDGTTSVKLRVTYTRRDGSDVTIPVFTLIEEEGGGISRYTVYFDLAPVFA